MAPAHVQEHEKNRCSFFLPPLHIKMCKIWALKACFTSSQEILVPVFLHVYPAVLLNKNPSDSRPISTLASISDMKNFHPYGWSIFIYMYPNPTLNTSESTAVIANYDVRTGSYGPSSSHLWAAEFHEVRLGFEAKPSERTKQFSGSCFANLCTNTFKSLPTCPAMTERKFMFCFALLSRNV